MKIKNIDFSHLPEKDQQAIKVYIGQQQQVRNQALSELQKLNPKLSPNPEVAHGQLHTFFLDQLDMFTYELAPDGSILVYDADGQPIANKQGYPLSFSDFVYQTASKGLDLEGAPTNSLIFKGAIPALRFKDEKDYLQQYYQAKTREEKTAIVDRWNLQQTTAK